MSLRTHGQTRDIKEAGPVDIRRGIIAVTILLGLVAISCGGSDVTAAREEKPATPGPSSTEEEVEEPDFSCNTTRRKADLTLAAMNRQGGYEWDWKPKRMELPAGQKVTLKIANPSNAAHDFSAGSCVSKNLGPKRSTSITFTVPDRPVTFYCSLHPQSMVGKIVPV